MIPNESDHGGPIAVNTTVVHYSRMSREDSQFKLRMPADLRETIENAAKEANRSLNAEIVSRLELSAIKESPRAELMPAKKARQVASIARQSIPGTIKDRILQGLNLAVSRGHATAGINFKDLELESLPEGQTLELIDSFSAWLENAGYVVEWDGLDSIWIRFDDL